MFFNKYTQGKTEQHLKEDTMLFYAVVKNIEIIGEAAYHLTKAFCNEHPENQWNDIMRMHNVLVHDYYQIRIKAVWGVITDDLPPLREQISSYLANVDWDQWGDNQDAVVETAVHKNLVQSAKRMKRDGLTTKQISRYTGLSAEEIEAL